MAGRRAGSSRTGLPPLCLHRAPCLHAFGSQGLEARAQGRTISWSQDRASTSRAGTSKSLRPGWGTGEGSFRPHHRGRAMSTSHSEGRCPVKLQALSEQERYQMARLHTYLSRCCAEDFTRTALLTCPLHPYMPLAPITPNPGN